MDIEKTATQVSWKHMFKTITIPINAETDAMFGSVANRVYVVDHSDGMNITVYDSKGKALDQRKYSHEFVSMFETNGVVNINYYSKKDNGYFTCQLMSSAGITSVNAINPPAGAAHTDAQTVGGSKPAPAAAKPVQAAATAAASPAPTPASQPAAPAAQPAEKPAPEKKDYVITEL